MEHRDQFVLEIKRILKPGGRVMVIDWSEISQLGPQTVLNKIAAQALFEKAGFTFVSTFNAGDHHYGLIFKK